MNTRNTQKMRLFPSRAPKHHWTAEEDVELEKGFQKYGFQWHLIVKDPDLKFEGRSGGQIRDRFRLRFPELYNQQKLPNYVETHSEPGWEFPGQYGLQPTNVQWYQCSEKMHSLQNEKLSCSYEQVEPDETSDNGIRIRADHKTTTSFGAPTLTNGEDEDNKLSNSILHDDWGCDDNLTLAPLAWYVCFQSRPIRLYGTRCNLEALPYHITLVLDPEDNANSELLGKTWQRDQCFHSNKTGMMDIEQRYVVEEKDQVYILQNVSFRHLKTTNHHYR